MKVKNKKEAPSSIELLCKKHGIKYSKNQPPNGTALVFLNNKTKDIESEN
jgi:hypothetical protein